MSGPLRVYCLSVSSALGGSERSLADFAVRAGAHGIEPVVIVPKEGVLANVLRAAGVRVLLAPVHETFLGLSQRPGPSLGPAARLARLVAAVPRLAAGLWRWSRAIRRAVSLPDVTPQAPRTMPRAPRPTHHAPRTVFYSNGFKAHLVTLLLRGDTRVWHLREFPPEITGRIWRWLTHRVPDAVIANSRAVAEAWEGGAGGPTVVYNGVDLEAFRPAGPAFWIHDRLGLPREARLVGMPAVFARWKGHFEVVEAFELAVGAAGAAGGPGEAGGTPGTGGRQKAATALAGAHLVLVGGPTYDTAAETGYAEELARIVGRSPVRDRIHFLKFQERPERLYPEFELVVHFSTRPEPFGRVIVEAMACGVPVIAARAGGPLELVEDGVTGWLITPGDVGALAAALARALRAWAQGEQRPGLPPPSPSGREAMSAACRRAAEARFSADRYATQVAAVLKLAAGLP